MGANTRVLTPNPYSPYADADPAYLHTFPGETPPPRNLTLTNCQFLAVVPEGPPLVITPDDPRPDGVCPECLPAAASTAGDDWPGNLHQCRECHHWSRHRVMCGACRQNLHVAWWLPHSGHIGNTVRAERDWLQHDRETLARLLGVTIAQIVALENGHFPPTRHDLQLLGDLFGMSVERLLGAELPRDPDVEKTIAAMGLNEEESYRARRLTEVLRHPDVKATRG